MVKIRKASKKDLKQLAAIYKTSFKVHNIFSKSIKEIIHYLDKLSKEAAILVAERDNKVVGGIVIELSPQTPKHTLATFKHIAVHAGHRGRDIGTMLIKSAEKEVGKGKVEIKVSENEKNAIRFYRKIGFKVEGKLKSHYRPRETCYVMGKVLE